MQKNRGDFGLVGKRGQVTIFIIIAIVIVVLGALIYLFYPSLKSTLGFETKNPSQVLEECLSEDLKTTIDAIGVHGGTLNPGNYITYKDDKIEYLCYVNEYYKPCVNQKPNLIGEIENQIYLSINDKANLCFDQMKKSYENAGYEVQVDNSKVDVVLLPKRVGVIFNGTVVLTRGESQRFKGFNVVLNNNIYELASIAQSIANWEARYGDADVTNYMNYYRNLKVQKLKRDDGSKLYIITDTNTENKFQFGVRSYAFPAGY